MKEKNLRLRLVVRRHGLPEVRVIFNVPLDHDPTVAKLVELVNETIPLESGDWGLEDYVVELRDGDGHAFECLHFQPVTSILEKDEEVFIRPLFSEDIKKRRLSGRYQISSDGKHLIDGIAFGRQRLKTPRDRPAVHISPRKRRRLTYDEAVPNPVEDSSEDEYGHEEEDDDDDDEDYEENDEPLLLTEHGELEEDDTDDPTSVKVAADFEDADVDGDDNVDADEEEADGDFGLDGMDDDEDMDLDDIESTIDANELNALREEVAEMEGWEDEEGPLPTGLKAGRENRLDLSTLDRITALRAAFPSVPADRCEKLLLKHKDDKKVYKKLAKSHQPQMGLENMLAFNTSLRQPSPAGGMDEMSEVGSEDEVSSVVRHFDQHGFPPGSIAAGNALEHMAQVLKDSHALNAMKLVNKKFDDESHSEAGMATTTGATVLDVNKDATSSSGSSSDSELDSNSEEDGDEEKSDSDMDSPSDDDSSSSDSDADSDSDSDSGPEEAPTRRSRSLSSSSHASDTSSSGSSSSDEEDGSIVGSPPNGITGQRNNLASSDEDSSDDSSSDESSSDDTSSSESDSESESNSATTTPKKTSKTIDGGSLNGPTSTIPPKENVSTTASPYINIALVPPGQGMSKTQKRNARRRAAKQAKRAEEAEVGNSSFQLEEAAIGTPGNDPELLARKRALMDQFETSASQPEAEVNQPSVSDNVQHGDAASPNVPADKPDPPAMETPSTTSSQRKMKLDVSAGRRMLFGALGIKNPKSKPDEERIRTNLMKGVRPLINSRIEKDQPDKDVNMTEAAAVANEDDDGDWRDKINYRAVECCQEGVELSEPPFPFVQRWDPQQQGRGGKGKRKQRNQSQFYQDEEVQHKTKKRKVSQPEEQTFDNSYYDQAEADNGDIELNYDDEPSLMDKDRTTAESQVTDLDDLPSLPSDLSSLPQLRPGEAKLGMVITWTAWLLTSATGWQPQVSNLTGIITKIEDNGTMLEVLLARRDRNLDRNEKNYDEETGQRLYDRFEAPDLEDEEADHLEAEGYRKLSFTDLGDPRIVQQPLNPARDTEIIEDSQPNAQGRGDSLEKSRSQSDHSRTLGRDESEKRAEDGEDMEAGGQAFESIITNTDNGQSSLSLSTQPGQVLPVDSQPQVELRLVPTGAGTDKEVTPLSSQGSNNSPSRQLEDMSEAAYAASLQASRQSSHQSLGESQPLDDQVDQDIQEDHATAGDAMAKVDYPKLNLLSSTDSVHSGRQPEPSLSDGPLIESLPRLTDTPNDSVPAEKTPAPVSQDNLAVITKQAHLQSSPARSDISNASSIPSLSQVWHSASQAEPTSAVPRSSRQVKAPRIQDEEYEAAMRKLEEASDEESEKESAQAPLKKLPHRSVSDVSTKRQPRVKKELQTFEESVSPPSLPKTRRRRAASPFTVPAGSQVVSLTTSSPEPDCSENYAEDSVDESYGVGKAGLKGGWSQTKRGLRGVSLPARESTKAYTTRRVTASQAPESKAGVRI